MDYILGKSGFAPCDIEPFEKTVWLSSPTMHGEEIKYIQEAYESNWMSTIGANINAIEASICEKIGCKYAVALSAGTAALHLAIKLAGVKPGDKVLCTDLTFAATVNPVAYEGATAVFVDSERDTWNMDPIALEKAFELYPEARVVDIAHLYGTPAKMDELVGIAHAHGAVIVEDAAESLGASYRGKQTGQFGEYSCISFNGNKIITGSSGGMYLTNSKEDADLVRKWSTQSRENVPWYQHEQLGYNYRMSNVIAGVVRGQIPYLEEHIAQKKAIYERYCAGFSNLPIEMNPYDAENSEPNFWLSCFTVNPEALCPQRLDDMEVVYQTEPGKSCPHQIIQAIYAANAQCRPLWKPMHMQPIYKNNPFVTAEGDGRAEGVVSVSEDLYTRGMCLPSDNKMTSEQQDKIIRIVRNCFE